MIFHFEAVEDKDMSVCGSGWLQHKSGDKGRSKKSTQELPNSEKNGKASW